MIRRSRPVLILLGLVVALPLQAAGPDDGEVKASLDKAIAFLKTRQNEDGSFAPRLAGPGLTALVASGLIRNGISPDDPVVAKALAYLEKQVEPNGSVKSRGL